jgi:SAM-dependent methyltransferase
VPQIDRSEGRRLFGLDPAGYDSARPGHVDRAYEILVERCGLAPGTSVLEIGPGTGQATRRLLALGASPLLAIEPDPALAAHLEESLAASIVIRGVTLEDAALAPASFDLAVAASSFHWVDERIGLAKLSEALRPGGWVAIWWTLFGEGGKPDAFMQAIDPLLENLDRSPTVGAEGRPPHALDTQARAAALDAAGFESPEHELIRWSANWDSRGIRDLYATFSPIANLDTESRTAILGEIARVAEQNFGGRVERTLLTSIYTARRPVVH